MPLQVGDSCVVWWRGGWWPANILKVNHRSYHVTFHRFGPEWNGTYPRHHVRRKASGTVVLDDILKPSASNNVEDTSEDTGKMMSCDPNVRDGDKDEISYSERNEKLLSEDVCIESTESDSIENEAHTVDKGECPDLSIASENLSDHDDSLIHDPSLYLSSPRKPSLRDRRKMVLFGDESDSSSDSDSDNSEDNSDQQEYATQSSDRDDISFETDDEGQASINHDGCEQRRWSTRMPSFDDTEWKVKRELASDIRLPLEYAKDYITNEFLEIIVAFTNLKARQVNPNSKFLIGKKDLQIFIAVAY
ncbi:MAG: hypothetical protein AAGK05_16550, partial [Pseudomonadota bacterium]